jgi:hypothetical protein
MRTTLDLDKPVLQALKRLQKQEKATLGAIASRLLAEALQRHEANRPASPTRLPWMVKDMKSRVDLSDKEALFQALDRNP